MATWGVIFRPPNVAGSTTLCRSPSTRHGRPLRGRYVLSIKDRYNHWARYHRVLAEMLDDARDGKL